MRMYLQTHKSMKWLIALSVAFFLLAVYTQEVILLIGGAALLFVGGVLFWVVAKYVLMVVLLGVAIFGFFAILGLILGFFL